MENILQVVNNDSNPTRIAVDAYLERGWVPNPTVGKRAVLTKWTELTLDAVRAGADEMWPPGTDRGVGIVLGAPSNGLVDVDIDCAEARAASRMLLLPTGMIWGRASAPDSHSGFVCAVPPAKTVRYADPVTRATLIELRSTGGQTCVPPTVLATKNGPGTEPVVWFTREMGEPTAVTADDLGRAVAAVAAAALVARYWPAPGGRHDAHLALAGGLVRDGVASDGAERFVRAVCAATNDDEIDDRVQCVASTATRSDGAGETTGWSTLAGTFGEHGPVIVRTARKWLGLADTLAPAPGTPAAPAHTAVVHDISVSATFRKPGSTLVTTVRGATDVHRDVISLDSATARDRYTDAAVNAAWPDESTRPTDARAAVRDALLRFASNPPDPASDESSDVALVADPFADPRPAALARMHPDVVAAAEEMLRDPHLIERIGDDIARVGVTGERKLATMLYLVGTSVQLPRPLSAMVIGATSSGKSYTVNTVQEMFPIEMKLLATDMTAQALYYLEPGRLHHRWVIAGERFRVEDEHRADSKRALREMLEAQFLRKVLTVTGDGMPQTITIEQRGPIAFTETTTNAEIFDEDRNRCLSLYTDESPEHTRAILRATAERAAGKTVADAAGVIAVHHAAQRMIPRCDVVVPFASEIESKYPAQRVDARRAFRHLLQVVKAVALLHFAQRERDTSGNVIATRHDYRIAADLAAVPLAVSMGGLTDGALQFYLKLTSAITPDLPFSVGEAVEKTGCPKSSAHRYLADLAAAHLVEVERATRGRTDVWRRTHRPLPATMTLPVLGETATELSAEADTPMVTTIRRGPTGPAPFE